MWSTKCLGLKKAPHIACARAELELRLCRSGQAVLTLKPTICFLSRQGTLRRGRSFSKKTKAVAPETEPSGDLGRQFCNTYPTNVSSHAFGASPPRRFRCPLQGWPQQAERKFHGEAVRSYVCRTTWEKRFWLRKSLPPASSNRTPTRIPPQLSYLKPASSARPAFFAAPSGRLLRACSGPHKKRCQESNSQTTSSGKLSRTLVHTPIESSCSLFGLHAILESRVP